MSNNTSERLATEAMRWARVLNSFNGVEIAVTGFLCYHLHLLLEWYKAIMTLEHFNAPAYWGAVGGLIAGVVGLVKYMYHTGVDLKPPKQDGH